MYNRIGMSDNKDPFEQFEELRKQFEEATGTSFDNFNTSIFEPPAPDAFFDALADPTTTPEQIEAFLQNGVDPNRSRIGIYQQMEYAVATASSHPNPVILETILKAGADPNTSDENRYTALSYANTLKHIQLLIQYGATYPEPTTYGETPLRNAYHFAKLDIVRFLIENGAPISEMKTSPIHLALILEEPTLAVALKENPGSLEAKDTWSRSPLNLAFFLGDIRAIQTLIAAGASTSSIDHVGQTCIHFAAASNNPEAMQLAEEYGFDIGMLDGQNHFPLTNAVEYEAEKILTIF